MVRGGGVRALEEEGLEEEWLEEEREGVRG